MLLALSDVTYVLIGWFKFLLLKFLYEYGPWPSQQMLKKVLFLWYIIKHASIEEEGVIGGLFTL